MNTAIIPAYNPDEKLISLVDKLVSERLDNILVVDDGSAPDSSYIFDGLNSMAIVLRHKQNRGKGAALKTAFQYIVDNNIFGSVVTLDADGQHRPEDAVKLLEKSLEQPEALVLGSRDFSNNIPLRSRTGNLITRYVFRIFSGKWVSDTQTGLRAFSATRIPLLLGIEGERYEYETNMLIRCAKLNLPLIESPIATIYTDKENSNSHFRTIQDSARIYGNLFVFAGSSFLSFLLDYIVFFPLVWLFEAEFSPDMALIFGNITARIISAGFNYHLNSTYVFKNKENRRRTLLQYCGLACSILLLNTMILYILRSVLGLDKAIAKVITELLLFIVSFLVQKTIIFKKQLLQRKGKLKNAE